MRLSATILTLATQALTGCAGGSDPADDASPVDTALPEAPSYAAPGPYAVGTAETEITGTDGLRLPVQIWYPSSDATGTAVVYDGLLAGEAWADAAPDCTDPRPLLAFSHGFGGTRYQSPFFTEFLASHGYVVVAPDHVGNTFTDLTGDVLELFERRPVDVRDTVDWLFAAAVDQTSPYVGCVDVEGGYAVAGHSFGGYTAFAAAGAEVNLLGRSPDLGDERVRAVVALAPWNGEGALTSGTSAITAPTMVLTGARDETTVLSTVEEMWEGLTVEPRVLGVFPDAGHYSFSPVACLLETGDGCGDGFLEIDRFTAIVQTASAAFLEGTRGVPGALDQLPVGAVEAEWTLLP